MHLRKSLLAGAAVVGLTFAAGSAAAQGGTIVIGTGSKTGLYYQTGAAICALVNKSQTKPAINCKLADTEGSVENLNGIRSGEFQMALAQSDAQAQSYMGSGRFRKKGAFGKLRSVFAVYPEAFTVLARAQANVKSFADLKGKRVNIGPPGTGQSGTMRLVMGALGWKSTDFRLAYEFGSADQSLALCTNKIDVAVFVIGHPSQVMKKTTSSCKTNLVPVTGAAIDALVAKYKHYRNAVIPGGLYANNPGSVMTFGVMATFVSRSSVAPDVVYAVVKSVFDNFAAFKRAHPALANLREHDMITGAMTAPMHKGAARYYKERGWIK